MKNHEERKYLRNQKSGERIKEKPLSAQQRQRKNSNEEGNTPNEKCRKIEKSRSRSNKRVSKDGKKTSKRSTRIEDIS